MNNLIFIVQRKLENFVSQLKEPAQRKAGKRYIQEKDIPLPKGPVNEISPVPYDLYNLHKTVMTRRPQIILEFGVGFSTLVLCNALMEIGQGYLYTVDTSKDWLENTRAKLPDCAPVDLVHSNATVREINGELCHTFECLPDVRPNMVYLDGPYGPDVLGTVNGLSFDGTPRRPEISADILLLESTLPASFLLIIDGRDNNRAFLQRNLKRNYKINNHPALGYSTFELIG